MLKNAFIILSVVAALGLTVAAPVFAKNQNQNQNKNVHVKKNVNVNKNVNVKKNVNVNKSVHVNKNVHANYVVGRKYNGHVWYGRNRHRWHGAYYDYGVGPCWVDADGLWFWNVVACP